jgi:hypothetical protein
MTIMAKKKKPQSEDTPPWSPAEWNAYQERLHNSVGELEAHLGLAAGTIWSSVSGTDAEVIIKTYAIIEPVLNEVLRMRMFALGGDFKTLSEAQDSLESFIDSLAVRGRAGKANLARDLGFIADHDLKFIDDITTLRNRYAHDIRNLSLSVRDLCSKMGPNGERIAKELVGLADITDQEVYNDTYRVLMYFNVASFISRAMQAIKPPPPPPMSDTSLLGQFLAKQDSPPSKND